MRRYMTVVEAMIFLGFVAGLTFLSVKIYEWRQDVLYGPYIIEADQCDVG